MRVHGKRFDGPVLKSGVRQGCPLSGLLFAIVTEPVIRLLARSLGPRGSLRAYADDLGACVANFVFALSLFGRAFSQIAAGTSLLLKVKKTIFIPLWEVLDFEVLRATIVELVPEWRDILIKYCGKYLGFCLGPDGHDHMWKKL